MACHEMAATEKHERSATWNMLESLEPAAEFNECVLSSKAPRRTATVLSDVDANGGGIGCRFARKETLE